MSKTYVPRSYHRSGQDYYTHETPRAAPRPFHYAIQRSYNPGKSLDDDYNELMKYIGDLNTATANAGTGRLPNIVTEEDWEDAPIHKPQNIPSQWSENKKAWETFGNNFNLDSKVKRNDLVNNYQTLLEEWNKQRVASGNRGEDFNSYLREIDKLIRADTERLGKMPLAEYKSKLPQMSMLTQKAADMRDVRKNRQQTKGTAYNTKINNLINRARLAPSFSDDQLGNMTDYLRGQGKRGNDDIIRKFFKDEYRGRYQDESFKDLTDKALNKDAALNKISLKDLSEDFGSNQTKIDRVIANAFRGLGRNKDTREEKLIDTTEKFGNQQHIFDETADAANKKVFDIEAYLPYSKLSNLRTILSNVELEPGNPDSERKAREAMNKGLADYGIAGTNSANNKFNYWDQNRLPNKPVFTESLTEELPPGVLESQYTLQRLNPKFRSDQYNTKKDIQKDLYGSKATLADDLKNKTLSSKAYDKAMKVAPEELALLDLELEEATERMMNQMRNKYTRLNQYRSPQHIKESEKRAQELTEIFGKKRSNIFTDRLKRSEQQERDRIYGQAELLSDISDKENADFDNMIDRILETNNMGIRSWDNLQSAKDQKTNSKLKSLGFAESIPSLGSRFTKNMNPTDEANFRARSQHYLNRGPLKDVTPRDSLYLSDVNRVANFNESDKANDAYAHANTNSLKNTFQYDPMVKQDQAQAALKYGNQKSEADARKKRIELEAEEARKKALREAANNAKGIVGNKRFKLQGLLDASKNEALGNQLQIWDKIARLLEEETSNRFALDPKRDRHFRSPTGVFNPREKERIKRIAEELLAS